MLSWRDKYKNYWQMYYAKNKDRIKARLKINYNKEKQMYSHTVRYHNDKQYRKRCLQYAKKYKEEKRNLPKIPIPNGCDKSLFSLDLYS